MVKMPSIALWLSIPMLLGKVLTFYYPYSGSINTVPYAELNGSERVVERQEEEDDDF
jgi:hypothetical protein